MHHIPTWLLVSSQKYLAKLSYFFPEILADWVTVIWIIIVLVWISANLVLLWYGGIAKVG
jgi:hypothetical protein